MTLLELGERPAAVLVETARCGEADARPAKNAPECIERLGELTSEPSTAVEQVLDSLSKVLNLLRPETPSPTLWKAKAQLTRLHLGHVVWQMTHCDQPHIWNRFLHLYCSIPDRLATVLDISEDDVLSNRRFIQHLASGLSQCHDAARISGVVAKSSSIGGMSVMVETMIRENLHEHVKSCLSGLGQPSLDSFLREMLHSLHVLSTDPLDLLQRTSVLLDNLGTRLQGLLQRVLLACPADVFATILYAHPGAPSAQLTRYLLEVWAVKCNLLRTPLHQQRHATKLLLAAMSYCSYDDLRAGQMEGFMMEGIQQRLDSSDEELALMGKVVAECFGVLAQTETKLSFELSDPLAESFRESFLCGQMLSGLLAERDMIPFVKGEADWMPIGKPTAAIEDYATTEPVIKGAVPPNIEGDLRPVMKITARDEEPRNAKIKRPRFLRDALAYLKCSDDPQKLEPALDGLAGLLESSSALLREEIGAALYCAVLQLGEDFGIPNFDTRRRETLACLICDVPHVVGKAALQELVGRGASLRMKLEIVTSCMVALRDCSAAALPKGNAGVSDIRMRLLDKEMGFSPSTAKPAVGKVREIVRNLILPLLTLLQDANAKIFSASSNALLLERTLYLIGFTASQASSFPEYPGLLQLTLVFVRPLLSTEALPRPILRAVIAAIQSALSAWPAGLSVLPHVDALVDIAKFLEGSQQLLDLDADYLALAGSAVAFIQERADPIKLLHEAASAMALGPNEVRIR